VREYEIGSEAWMRDRVERGLDPGEADRPADDFLLAVESAVRWPDAYPEWAVSYARTSLDR
jgi:hypothetical protein